MKGNVTRGAGFRGVLEYVCSKDETPDIVGGNMFGETPRELASEFGASRQLRPDIKKPVWHCSLALPAGETVTADNWCEIAENMMLGMDLDPENHQYVAVRHSDTEYDHIHIVASRIGLDGNVWHGKWEARRAIEATQDLEKKHGLTITPGLESKPDNKRLTRGELNKAVRTKQEPPRQVLQRLVTEAMKGNPTASEFAERLDAVGVSVWANIATTGKLNGFSFGYQGEAYSGTQLGKNKYTWSKLQKQGVTYGQDRDRETLEQLTRRAKANAGNQESGGVAEATDRDQPDQENDRTVDGGWPGSDQRAGTAPVVVGPGPDARDGGDSLRQTDSEVGRPGENGDRIDGKNQRPGENRNTEIAGVDAEGEGAPSSKDGQRQAWRRDGQAGGREGQQTGPERLDSRIQCRQIDGSGYGPVGLGGLVSDLWNLADRQVIAVEQARKAIDDQLTENPAPARPVGRRVATSRLSRWFSVTKAKLSRFIDKAMSYFNDAAVRSADKAGWAPDEIRSAGLSGDLLNRAEELLAEEAAEQARRQQEIQAEEAAKANEKAEERMKPITEANRNPPEKPQEPDILFFDDEDDEESLGPGLV